MSVHHEEQRVEQNFSQGQVLMPFYIICDVSGSMSGTPINELNAALRTLVDDILQNPVAADVAMLSVISFADTGVVEVPLSRPEDVTMPTLTPRGSTSFAAALETYHSAFERDRQELKAAGSWVYRPCIFFLTDGYPNPGDPYPETFQRLLAWDPNTEVGNAAFPYVVSYGFGDAVHQPEHVKAMAYPNFGPKRGQWFVSASTNVHALLESIMGSIGKTVISSGLSVPTGQPRIVNEPPVDTSQMQFGEAGDYV